MKLTNKILTQLVEEVLNEQPPAQQQDKEKEEPQEKPLKTDIPNSPFEPDVNQVKDELTKILKQWEIKQYPSDQHRWKSYYVDIAKLLKKLNTGESNNEI
tara:strand:- start:657 stop:956 length:300 start_codon:yes stop_codon:yes gene_type:complete